MRTMKILLQMMMVVSLCFRSYLFALDAWEWVRPKPQGNTIYDVQFVSSYEGWAVGKSGTILHLNYPSVPYFQPVSYLLNTSRNLYSINFYKGDPQYGWIVGDSGTVYRTTNAGATWQYIFNPVSGSSIQLMSVALLDTQSAVAVGMNGFVMKTVDGGLSWSVKNVGTNVWLQKVTFLDNMHGFIVGNAGFLAKSDDGGETWNTIRNRGADLYDVQFMTLQVGWAVGDGGTILHTTDGGSTWISQTTGITYGLKALLVLSSSTILAVGESGAVLRSADGGNSWSIVVQSVLSRSLNSIARVDTSRLWVAGEYGGMMSSTDGGKSWNAESSSEFPDLSAVSIRTIDDLWAVGGKRVVHSTNSGITWEDMTVSPTNLYALHLLDSATVIVAGDGGRIFRTTDGGVSWMRVDGGIMSATIWAMAARGDAQDIWAVGDGGAMLASTDGGASWKLKNSGTQKALYAISFVDAWNGWAVGFGGTIIHTSDGGEHWVPQTSNTTSSFFDVIFLNVNRGWAIGDGGIFKTIDGGRTWQQVLGAVQRLRAIGIKQRRSGMPEYYGCVVGDGGTILVTKDGENWISDSSGTTNDLYGVSIFETRTVQNSVTVMQPEVLACGRGGTILKRNGPVVIVSINEPTPLPNKVSLNQNYPNPVYAGGLSPFGGNSSTIIRFTIPKTEEVTVKVYDVIGREVATLVNGTLLAGEHKIIFDAKNLPSGIYFYRLCAGDFLETKKMVLMR